jgi:hypothetical protein
MLLLRVPARLLLPLTRLTQRVLLQSLLLLLVALLLLLLALLLLLLLALLLVLLQFLLALLAPLLDQALLLLLLPPVQAQAPGGRCCAR